MFRLNRAFDHFRPAFAHHFAFVNLIPPRIEPSRVYRDVTSPYISYISISNFPRSIDPWEPGLFLPLQRFESKFVHPNFFVFRCEIPSIIDSPISVANGLLFSKNSSGITRALPLGAHRCLARVCVYTHTRTHAHTSTSHVLATWKRDTDSPTIELPRERENSEDKLSREEERTRKRVSRPRESNKFDTRTLSLSLCVCALVGFQACSRAARLYRRVICPDSANNRSIIL